MMVLVVLTAATDTLVRQAIQARLVTQVDQVVPAVQAIQEAQDRLPHFHHTLGLAAPEEMVELQEIKAVLE